MAWVAINQFIAVMYNTILSILASATSKNLAVSDLLPIWQWQGDTQQIQIICALGGGHLVVVREAF